MDTQPATAASTDNLSSIHRELKMKDIPNAAQDDSPQITRHDSEEIQSAIDERLEFYRSLKERQSRFEDIRGANITTSSLFATDDNNMIVPFFLTDMIITNRDDRVLLSCVTDAMDLLYLTRRFIQASITLKLIIDEVYMTSKIEDIQREGQIGLIKERISEIRTLVLEKLGSGGDSSEVSRS
jgi:hypothetical protein